MNELFEYMGIVGSFFLAVSGALMAINKKFDPFGVLSIAFVTAVGGGTLRDVLLTDKSVFWIEDPSYIYYIVLGTLVAIIFKHRLLKIQKFLLAFDTIGLSLFTIIGVNVGLEYNLDFSICLILGTLTGAFGGVLRDILVNQVPVIFKKEIYASTSIVGGAIYLILIKFKVDPPLQQIIPMVTIILLRFIIVFKNISFPAISLDKKK